MFVDATIEASSGEESFEAAIERVRAAVFDKKAQAHRLANAPLPAATVKAAIVAEIDAFARAGTPRVDISGPRVRIEWPDVATYAQFAPGGSVSKMFCALFRDAMVDILTAGVDAAIPEGAGIAAADRPARELELAAGILALEREEEALVMAAIAAGRPVARRRDVDVMALLGIGWPSPGQAIEPQLVAAE